MIQTGSVLAVHEVMSSEEEEQLVWREECVLGAGSFGRVRLFVNKVRSRDATDAIIVWICMADKHSVNLRPVWYWYVHS